MEAGGTELAVEVLLMGGAATVVNEDQLSAPWAQDSEMATAGTARDTACE